MDFDKFPESEEELLRLYEPRISIDKELVLKLKLFFWFLPNLLLNLFWIYTDGLLLQTYYLTFVGIEKYRLKII